MKIATILYPTDFSDASRHATDYATTIAQWYGAEVIPLHVQAPAYATVPALMGEADEAEPAFANGAHVVYSASPAAAIVECAATAKVDLIVMGTHGVGGFRHMMLGSVTETVLRQAECPVLTVPPRAESTAQLPFKRLLCAVDFSASSIAALRLAVTLTEESNAILEVLHVVDEPSEHALFVARPYDVHHHRALYDRHVLEHLDRLLLPIACDRVHARLRTARGNADAEILRAADAGIDVVVMGVGRSSDTSFGSTVNAVVRGARCPVLTVRH
ncbi:MAG TPA: universal stress protein [Vicinamibacterales bacterium]|nr:universal stress protein [Vicinamibacterales bacterium]